MKLPPDKIVNLVSHKAIIIYDLFGFRMTLARKRYLKPVFVLLFIKERQDCTFCACTLCAKKNHYRCIVFESFGCISIMGT